MTKKTIYTIATDRNLITFVGLVNEKLGEGWVCKGGMVTDGQTYYQSLVKYVDNPVVIKRKKK
jgi:hypothetical protein